MFPDGKLSAGAKRESALIASLIADAEARLQRLKPTHRNHLSKFKEVMLPAWQHTLQVEDPKLEIAIKSVSLKTGDTYTVEKLFLSRKDKGDRIPALLFAPIGKADRRAVVLVHPKGKAAFLGEDFAPIGVVQLLLEKNINVLLMDTFLTGEMENREISSTRRQADLFFTTYNLTDTQARVQDIITASAFLKQERRGSSVWVCGFGRAGLWALLAAPAVEGVVADGAQIDFNSDEELLAPDLFVPGFKKLGGFETVMSLAAPTLFAQRSAAILNRVDVTPLCRWTALSPCQLAASVIRRTRHMDRIPEVTPPVSRTTFYLLTSRLNGRPLFVT